MSDISETIIYGIQLWLTVASGEVVIMTLIWRYKLNEWWWQKKKKTKEWEFKISSDGWSMSGEGHNPIETLTRMVESWTAKRVQPERIIDTTHSKVLAAAVAEFLETEEYKQTVSAEARAWVQAYMEEKRCNQK